MIKIEDIHLSFKKNEVLKGISLDVEKGQVISIIGPSGSGKSTLLRSMNFLEKPNKGKITFEEYLRKENLSENTITSYLWTVNYFNANYDVVSKENLLAYRGDQGTILL